MAGLGESILSLMGRKDPRAELAAALAQGGGTLATPQGGVATPEAAPVGPGMPAPAAPASPPLVAPREGPTPVALQSPPDLSALYMKILERNRKAGLIDSGLGLIAAGSAQPENKAGILAAQGITSAGGGGGDGSGDMFSTIASINKMQTDQATKAALLAMVPSIAKQYGMDIQTATYLAQTGELQNVIKELEKPNRELQAGGDGRLMLVDKTDNTLLGTFGEPKTGLLSPEEEAQKIKIAQAGRASTTINNAPGNDLAKELAKTSAEQYGTSYEAATGARDTINSVSTARQRLDKGIVAGSILSPVELAGRKAIADVFGMEDETADNTEGFKAALRETVLSKIKALGSGTAISDADRNFIEQAVGGDIILNENSMQDILNILERGGLNQIRNHNNEVDALIESLPDDASKEQYKRLVKKITPPKVSNALLSVVTPKDIETLKANDNPEARAAFDEAYGLGFSSIVLGN